MAKHHHSSGGSWTERVAGEGPGMPGLDDLPGVGHNRPPIAFKPHSSGMVGHIIHMVGAFVPAIAAEFIDDAKKLKTVARLTSLGVGGSYEIYYLVLQYERQKHQAEKLAECRGRE